MEKQVRPRRVKPGEPLEANHDGSTSICRLGPVGAYHRGQQWRSILTSSTGRM